MKKEFFILRIGLIGLIGLIRPITSSAQFSGYVKDRKTQEPIAGATIGALTSNRKIFLKQMTKVSGEFRIKEGAVSFVHISALGYHDTTISVSIGNVLTVLLEQQPLPGEDVIVTAQKHTTAVQDVPISVSIVKSPEITGRSPESIDYTLRYIPGVSVTHDQVNVRGSSGYAQSVGSRVLFLIDGMPFLSADDGEIKFDVLPIMNVDRIEVVKGAGSALYGSSALGGVINVITRNPSEGFHGAISAFAGEYDQVKYPEWRIPDSLVKRRFASIEGGAAGTIGETGLLGSFALRRNEGYRLGDDSYKASGFAKVTTPFSDHDRFTTTLLLANENHGGFLYWKDLNHVLMPSDSLGAVNGRIHSVKANLQSSLQSILSDHFILISRGSINYTNFSTDSVQSETAPHSNATNYYLEFQGNSDIFDSLYLTSGILAQYQTVNSDLYQSHHGITAGAYLQGEYKLYPAIFTLGARADGTRYDATSATGSISPKFGITVDAANGLNFRGSIGTGFRAPTIGEKYIDQVFSGFHVVPNRALVPEKSRSTEIGGSYRTANLYIDGVIFYSTFDNLIEPHSLIQNGSEVIQFGNLTEAEIFGHEEVIEFYPLSNDDLSLRFGYTYVFPRDRITKQILNFRPRHLLQARAETKLASFSLSSDFRYISKYESADTILLQQVGNGDARVNAYIWDARIGYTIQGLFGMPVTLSFQVQNLLNYYYVEIVGNLAPIRNFSFRVETVF